MLLAQRRSILYHHFYFRDPSGLDPSAQLSAVLLYSLANSWHVHSQKPLLILNDPARSLLNSTTNIKHNEMATTCDMIGMIGFLILFNLKWSEDALASPSLFLFPTLTKTKFWLSFR